MQTAARKTARLKSISWLLTPVLAAAFPVVFLYVENISEVYPPTAPLAPLGVAILGALLATFVLRLVLRDTVAACFLASVGVLLFFLWVHFKSAIQSVSDLGPVVINLIAVGLTVFLALLALFVAARRRGLCLKLQSAITFALLALIAFNLVSVVRYHVRTSGIDRAVLPSIEEFRLNAGAPQSLPDIYYIVTDEYAAFSTLRDLLGYDNSAFLEFLERAGFYVATESYTRYPQTLRSLVTSLNMEYAAQLVEAGYNGYTLFEFNRVARILKEQGYTFVYLGAPWYPLPRSRIADENFVREPAVFHVFSLHGFSLELFWTTMAGTLHTLLGIDVHNVREATAYQLEKLAEMPDMPGPKFVLAHIFSPHEPYAFNPQGGSPRQGVSERELYLDQLAYITTRLEKAITQILTRSSTPPIIILQSDHGPRFLAEDNPRSAEAAHRILNAYYLPGDPVSALYPRLSPVNTFRVIFNQYFGADLELLDDWTLDRIRHPAE